ncbi:MAG: GDP-mannose 4,6-dehydratase [Anaeromyxobacter sp.]
MQRALVTGLAGQDGSFLADLLLAEGVEVHGTVRRGAPADAGAHPRLARHRGDPRLVLHPVELEDRAAVRALVAEIGPDELYHLTGTRKPVDSVAAGEALLEGAIGTTHALASALHAARPGAGFFFAASSELFAPDAPSPCDERTPFDPRSVYAIAKAAGVGLVRHYRERGLRAAAGILFNHESARRGPGYVTRAISAGAARVALGLAREVALGDLDARRDWGHARSFARAMTLMIRRDAPEDLVLATGAAHTVRDFAAAAFAHVGLDWRRHVVVDPAIPRPPRPGLVGNPARAAELLGWRDDVPFERLVAEMVDDDLETLRRRER